MSDPAEFPDYWLTIDRHPRLVTGRALIERPMDETDGERRAREKRGDPTPMVSYVAGRIVF